jgi:hypothetical protein
MQTATVPGMLTGELLAGIVLSGFCGPMAFFTEMLSTGVCYSGATIGYQIGAVVGGGLSPLIAASLPGWTGTINAVAAFVAVAAVLTIAAGPRRPPPMLNGEGRAQNAAVDRSRPSERTLR